VRQTRASTSTIEQADRSSDYSAFILIRTSCFAPVSLYMFVPPTHDQHLLCHLSMDGMPVRKLFDSLKRYLGLLRFFEETCICVKPRTTRELRWGGITHNYIQLKLGPGSRRGLGLYRPNSTAHHTHAPLTIAFTYTQRGLPATPGTAAHSGSLQYCITNR
jgi:hypothetical protein